MNTVSITRLKASLRKQLSRVKAGEEVIWTKHGNPISKIVPFDAGKLELSAHVSELARSGLIRLGSARIPKDVWDLPRPVVKHGCGLTALLEERGVGR